MTFVKAFFFFFFFFLVHTCNFLETSINEILFHSYGTFFFFFFFFFF